MRVLGIDPSGTTGAGYACYAWGEPGVADGLQWMSAVYTQPYGPYDACAVEGPWPHGPMGKCQMWALGLDAGWRLGEANAARKFILKPDEWRAAWGWAGKPKAVIVARLRRDLRITGDNITDDMVEAAGIAVALHRLLTTPGPKGKPWRPRKGCEVRR